MSTAGRGSEAVAEFERAIALDPNSYEGHYFYARHAFAAGDFEKAVALYSRCAEIDPDDYRAPFLITNALHALGRLDEEVAQARLGLERAERALKAHPENSDPAQHARSGHGAVLATAETIEIMKVRYGADCAGSFSPANGAQSINGVTVKLVPAGHILGSAQIVLDWQGARAVVSGDYKRSPDPTCAPFELVPCDLFVTEATFGLPVFRHGFSSCRLIARTSIPSRWPSPSSKPISAPLPPEPSMTSGRRSAASAHSSPPKNAPTTS